MMKYWLNVVQIMWLNRSNCTSVRENFYYSRYIAEYPER